MTHSTTTMTMVTKAQTQTPPCPSTNNLRSVMVPPSGRHQAHPHHPHHHGQQHSTHHNHHHPYHHPHHQQQQQHRHNPKRAPYNYSPRLPPELVDIVIDYTYDDKSTLKNLSLVSRRWLRSARYHLFYHLRVPASTEDGSHYRHFLQFIESSPHLGEFVRELHLCRGDDKRNSAIGVLDGPQLIPIVRRLPFLHTLILSQVHVVAPTTQSWTEFTMPLRKLVLSEIFSDCYGATWLVTVFKLYDTLHILDPIPTPEELAKPPVMTMPTDSFNLLEGLNSLVVESQNDVMSLRKVEGLMPFIMKNLTSLELLLELDQREQVVRLEDFLRSKGPQVRHLRLDINDVEIFGKGPGIHLTPVCPQLQSLQLCLYSSTYPESVAEDHWGYATSILSHGPRSLRRVTIGMIAHDGIFSPDSAIDWENFEQTLLALQDLEYVQFQAEGSRHGWKTTAECAQPLDEEWREYLGQKLPHLREKRLLRFLN